MAEPNDLGWIPADARRWAGENNALLEIAAGELVNTGHWPSAAGLTRRLARQGRPIPVADLLWRMPRTIGFIDTHADEVVILLQGLRMTAAGRPLLDGFIRVLRLAVERYASDDPNPVLRRADISFFSGNSDEWVRALSEVVLREAPFLGSGTGSVDDEWSREISDGIVRYWNVQSPDDYLEARAVELKAGAALGWEPIPLLDEHGQVIEPIEQFPAQPAGPKPGPATTRSNDRDGFVSHAGEDLEVAEGVGRLLTKMGWHIWLDKLEMTVGDTLTMALNEALARSRFGVVILSRAFFAKHWPQQELAALAAREATSGTKVILPGLARD